MADFLSTGISGLLAFQNALATTGHNISNVNTPGFSRQRAELATRTPQLAGSGYIGSGVNVAGVRRMYDQFTVDLVRTHTSQNSRLATYHDMASQVDNLLADPDAGLAPVLQNFFNAIQGVADNPSSVPAREVLISESDSLVERFHSSAERFSALADSVNSQMVSTTAQINSLADSIAKVNYEITISWGKSGGEPPNDLLDQRDELLRELSEHVTVTTVEQDNGAVNVFVGNGQILVLGADARGISTARDPQNQENLEIRAGRDGSGPFISDFIHGGELGGLLDFRRDILEPTQNAMGRIAVSLAMSVNEQHAQGLDIYGNQGREFFSVDGVGSPAAARPATTNSQPDQPSVTYSFNPGEVSKLTTSDYVLNYDGSNYVLTRLSDNQVVGSIAGVGGSFSVDGFTVEVSGDTSQRKVGDSFAIEPTRTAAKNLQLAIDNANHIAAAAPLRSAISDANLGTGKITNPTVTPVTGTDLGAVLTNDLSLMFREDADGLGNPGFVISGGAEFATDNVLLYDPATQRSGVTFDLGDPDGDGVYEHSDYAGITFTISGEPLDGDTFSIEKNDGAISDNRNALALAALQSSSIVEGTANLQSAYSQMVSGVGTQTHQLEINSKAQQTILDQAVQSREAISGVNLDEEAANLVRFQQAYQASAQLIVAANTLFQSLLDAVRR